MVVRLTKKLAEVVDGIDLTNCAEGDLIELADAPARLLIAENWAEPIADLNARATCAPRIVGELDAHHSPAMQTDVTRTAVAANSVLGPVTSVEIQAFATDTP